MKSCVMYRAAGCSQLHSDASSCLLSSFGLVLLSEQAQQALCQPYKYWLRQRKGLGDD